jgi:hypothetical protein
MDVMTTLYAAPAAGNTPAAAGGSSSMPAGGCGGAQVAPGHSAGGGWGFVGLGLASVVVLGRRRRR